LTTSRGGIIPYRSLMYRATTAYAFLRRLRPWLGRAVHVRWSVRRSLYQSEADALLLALHGARGTMPPELRLRIEGFLGRLYREWFPRTWRAEPTYAEVLADFRWWLEMAEQWSERRTERRGRGHRRPQPVIDQPPRLLNMLGLPPTCTEEEFLVSWRGFLKRNHPDLNPDQSPEERRRFADAVSLWRR
jgi:hypothetical protein